VDYHVAREPRPRRVWALPSRCSKIDVIKVTQAAITGVWKINPYAHRKGTYALNSRRSS
jgi:hypothetical protein